MNEAPIQHLESYDSRFDFQLQRKLHRMRRPQRQMRPLRRQFLQHAFPRRLLFWIGNLFGIAWAAPLTLFGLLIALPVVLFRGHLQLVRGHAIALLARGRLADFLLRHHPFGAMNAMALGHVVIATHDGLSSRVLIHELAHVRQAARWGILFPFAYLASSLWAVLRGKNAYWHNRFEVAARQAEKRF